VASVAVRCQEKEDAMRKRRSKPIIEKIRRVTGWSNVCLECGEEFTSRRPDAQMCSATCRSRRWRRFCRKAIR
jgi:hypothetical protein